MNPAGRGGRFPKTGLAQPLSLAGNGNDIHDNLKAKSSWYQSIIDPLHGADCKIPDDVGDETGCLQCVLRTTTTVPAIGNGSAQFITSTLYASNSAGTTVNGYKVNDTASTDLTFSFLPNVHWPTTSTLQQFAQGHRIVSAGLYVQPECSISDCSGELMFFVSPMSETPLVGGSAYRSIEDLYGTTLIALNSLEPMMVRWFPYSRELQTFNAFYDPNSTSVSDTSTPKWTLGFATSGVPGGVTFRVTCVINYEFLPKLNSIDILDVAPSPSDLTEMDLVESWVAEEPVAKPVPKDQMMSPPSVVQPAQEEEEGEDGFGMFVDVLHELLPLAAEGLSLML